MRQKKKKKKDYDGIFIAEINMFTAWSKRQFYYLKACFLFHESCTLGDLVYNFVI